MMSNSNMKESGSSVDKPKKFGRTEGGIFFIFMSSPKRVGVSTIGNANVACSSSSSSSFPPPLVSSRCDSLSSLYFLPLSSFLFLSNSLSILSLSCLSASDIAKKFYVVQSEISVGKRGCPICSKIVFFSFFFPTEDISNCICFFFTS
jgi:hypothetical protein